MAIAMRQWRLGWLSGVLLMWAVGAQAQPDPSYYRADIPVASQSQQERQRAAREAFLQVIFRISGFEATQLDASIQQRAGDAWRYVEQFQFGPLREPVEGMSLLLTLRFSSSAIEKILRDTRHPFWSNRPTTLVWLVEDDAEYGKQLLGAQAPSVAVEALAQAARERGLPLVYPVLDLEERLLISAEDVWGVNEEAITAASQRYNPDAILVGRYSRTSRGELWSTWHFFHAGAARSYDSRLAFDDNPAAPMQLGRDALYPLADFLAERYAIQPQLESGGRIVVQVDGVADYASYRRSLSYLEGLAAVSKVHVAKVKEDTVLLQLESASSVEHLLKVVALDNKLKRVAYAEEGVPSWEQTPEGSADKPLRFSWGR